MLPNHHLNVGNLILAQVGFDRPKKPVLVDSLRKILPKPLIMNSLRLLDQTKFGGEKWKNKGLENQVSEQPAISLNLAGII